MTPERFLLFGISSPVGQALQALTQTDAWPVSWTLCAPSRAACDIANPAQLRGFIQDTAPSLILNAAEMSDIAKAEANEAAAMAVNFHAPAQMAAQASVLDVPMIQLSTDLVFDGRQAAPTTTEDKMNPLSTYGGSKMMGEEALRHELAWHVIVRSSGVFSAVKAPQNPLTRLLDQLDGEVPLRLPADRFFAPTYAPDLARALVHIAQELLGGKVDGFGTYHVCGTPALSVYDFGCAVRDIYAIRTGRAPTLTATMSSEIDSPLRDPLRTALDCRKTQERYGLAQPDWHEGLGEAIAAHQNTKDR